jgi:hypothetical protein
MKKRRKKRKNSKVSTGSFTVSNLVSSVN